MKTSQTLQVETFSDILKQYQAEKTFFPTRINRSVGNHLINTLWLRATMLQVWYCSVVAVSPTTRLSTSTSTRPRGSLTTRSAKPTSVSRAASEPACPGRFLEKPSKSTYECAIHHDRPKIVNVNTIKDFINIIGDLSTIASAPAIGNDVW